MVKRTAQMAKDGMYRGKAGDYRVMSELIVRGINAFIPCVDYGIDILLQNGKKVQVKTSKLVKNKANNSRYYHFGLNRRKGNNNDKCDFYILWCLDFPKFSTFYIIPSENITLTGVDLFPHSVGTSPFSKKTFSRKRSKWEVYRECWDSLKT